MCYNLLRLAIKIPPQVLRNPMSSEDWKEGFSWASSFQTFLSEINRPPSQNVSKLLCSPKRSLTLRCLHTQGLLPKDIPPLCIALP